MAHTNTQATTVHALYGELLSATVQCLYKKELYNTYTY